MTRLDLPSAPRLLLEADLRPIQGTRFQPTGFPDLGAATYRLPDERGTEMLLVESAQSVANRLESAVWDDAEDDLVAPLRGLPYVKVVRDGKALTNSLLEAHRLNSVYIEKSDAFDTIRAAVGYVSGQPFDRQTFVRALCKYDPGCLLHGVFLESIAGVLRLPRALSGFIEAR
ncbi:CRISPR-associated protein GSU0053/csb1, Dpsyc system, partial [Nannocystis exedens]